jgi:hypothetical protein
MKKLVLNVDALRVESFATDEARDVGGTVQGHEDVLTPLCVQTQAADTCWCTERHCP